MAARDYALFRVEVLNRWVRANVEGVREGDPDALCTVGYLQDLNSADKLLGARHVDFSNMHAYLAPDDFARSLKIIDRRFEGKTFSLGEFGAKCHPAWNPGAFVGVTEAEGADHFLRIGHYSLGIGAGFIANWSWKDMIDCVFPWGIVHPGDGVPKDVLPAYRNMSLFFRLFRPAYRDPGLYLLVPDNHRLGGGKNTVEGAVLNAIQGLLDARVPFNVINEFDLDRLPAAARTLVWPIPTCPDDAAYARVKAFVTRGGTLLVSGDLSYDVDRKPTRAGRLEELCGVRRAGGAGDVPDLRALVPVAPAQAQPVGGGEIPLFRHALGAGSVFYTPVPVEMTADDCAPLYRRVLAAAGVKAETPEAPAGVFCARVETVEAGGTWVMVHAGAKGAPARVSAARTSLMLAPGKTGLLRVDGDGLPLAVEAQGAVTCAGRQMLEIAGHAMVAALDGKALGASRAVLVLPVGAGEVRFTGDAAAARFTGDAAAARFKGASGWKDAVVQAGEFRRGRWTVLSTEPAAGKGGPAVRIPAGRRNDLFLLCERADAPRWAASLEALLRFE